MVRLQYGNDTAGIRLLPKARYNRAITRVGSAMLVKEEPLADVHDCIVS